MEIKKLIILISVILSFLKSKFEKTNKKYLNNIKKSIGKKKIFLIHLSSIGSSIYTSCYLKRLIIEKKISSQNLVIISDGNYINSFWKKKLINNFEIAVLSPPGITRESQFSNSDKDLTSCVSTSNLLKQIWCS